MPDSQDFNTQKDINRYLQQQGRAPQSHLDWETWRKVGQPGTYQAPPGSGQQFKGVSSGAGGPNYGGAGSNYNMFKDTGDAIASALAGPTAYVQKKFAKMGKDKSGSTASSRNGSDMADDGSMGPPIAGGGRSQNASITAPASSRGMRRSRGGDFSGALAAHNITMVQGNDNYGTVNGNMGGANVGGGSYDNSFQSKNTGGNQTAFSFNNNGSGNNPPPINPTPPPTPPNPPRTPKTPNNPNTPGNPPVPPTPPQIGGPTRPKRPQIPVGNTPGTPPQIGAPPVGPQTPVQGPVGPQKPVQGSTSKDTGLMGHANDANGGPESDTARRKLTESGVNGPWRSETAGPQAPAPSMLPAGAQQPMTSPVEGPTNPASKGKGRKINEQGGVGARKYGPAKPKPTQGPVEGPKSGYAQVKERNQRNEGNKKAEPMGAAGEGTTATSGSKSTTKSTVKTMGKGKK
jgi:hypothetical protein